MTRWPQWRLYFYMGDWREIWQAELFLSPKLLWIFRGFQIKYRNCSGRRSLLMVLLSKWRPPAKPGASRSPSCSRIPRISCHALRKSVPGQRDDVSYSFPLVQRSGSTPSLASLSSATPLGAWPALIPLPPGKAAGEGAPARRGAVSSSAFCSWGSRGRSSEGTVCCKTNKQKTKRTKQKFLYNRLTFISHIPQEQETFGVLTMTFSHLRKTWYNFSIHRNETKT